MRHASSRFPMFRWLVLSCLVLSLQGAVSGKDEGVTAREIYRMHRDGLSAEVLREHIRINGFAGDFTKETERKLRESGVSEFVIRQIRQVERSESSPQSEERNAREPVAELAPDPPPKRKPPEKARKSDKGKEGVFTLSSRSEDTVWFRIDRSNRVLRLSLSETYRFIGLSEGNSIQLPVKAGPWHVTLKRTDRKRRVNVVPGQTAHAIVLRREEQGLHLRWYEDHPGGNGKELFLERKRTSFNVKKSRLFDSDDTGAGGKRGRVLRRSGSRRFSISPGRSGAGHVNTGFYGPASVFSYGTPVRIIRFGHRGLHRKHRRSPNERRRDRGGFHFHLNLNQSFGHGNARGSLRLNSMHRHFQIGSSHSD